MRERGLNCFPLLPFSKKPNIEWTIYQTEKCDLPIQTNYAVMAGKTSNNLFIVDPDTFDLYDGFKDFNTLTVKTGKGYHFYFYAKDGKLPQTIRLKNDKNQELDIRSQGAYVVGAGSIYEDKKTVYTIVNNAEIMTIDPQIIKERLVKLGFNPEFREKRMVELFKGVKEGERDRSVYRLGMAMRHSFGLEDADLLSYLNYFNQHSVFPPLPDVIVKQKVQSAMNADVDKIRFKEFLDEADLKEVKLKYDDNFWKEIEDLCAHYKIKLSSLKFKCENCKRITVLKPETTDHKNHMITVIYQ